MLNYAVDPDLLRPYVPFGTELDSFGGQTFISLVGFRFLRTKVLGVCIPFHRDFDEVNPPILCSAPCRRNDPARRGVHSRDCPAIRHRQDRAPGLQRELHMPPHVAPD